MQFIIKFLVFIFFFINKFNFCAEDQGYVDEQVLEQELALNEQMQEDLQNQTDELTQELPDSTSSEDVVMQPETDILEANAYVSETEIVDEVKPNEPIVEPIITPVVKPKIKEPKLKPSQVEEEKKQRAVISSLDTLSVDDEGNWLLKRVWWEQAELTFEKIIEVNDQIIQVQTVYFNNQKDVDKQIANAFKQLGYEQSQLELILSNLLERIAMQTASQETLTDEETELINAINAKKKQLEKIKEDLATLAKFELSVDDVLNKLSGQVNLSRDYEKKAWADFKEIGRILNDKQAKVLFYQVDAVLKNVQNILNYLRNDLQNYFNDILQKTNALASDLSAQLDALNKEGINLKEDFEKFKALDEKREQDRANKEQDALRPRKKPKGWFATIGDWFLAPVNWVTSFFKK